MSGVFHVRYWYEILDWDNNILDELVGVETGGHAESSQATVHTSGSVMIRDTGQVDSWADAKVRAWVEVNGESWPIGTYVPSIPEWTHTSGGVRSARVVLADKLSLLDTAYHRPDATRNQSVPVTEQIRFTLRDDYNETATVEGSSVVFPNGYSWDQTESQLHHFNNMLRGINYFSLSTDGYGRFEVRPYVDPSERGVRVAFIDGKDGVRLARHSLYGPEFTVATDFNTPNIYAAISQGDAGAEGVYYEYRNMSSTDPMSIPNRGRIIWPEGGVESNAQVGTSELAGYVRRRYREVSRSSTTIQIDHPPMRLRFNDVVTFESGEYGIEGHFVVERIDATHTFDSLWRTRLRKVAI